MIARFPVLIFTLAACAAQGQTPAESTSIPARPRPRLDQNRLALIALDVSVVDSAGQPVPFGEVTCYGHELGLIHPDPGRGNALKNGRFLMHLPTDSYTIIASGPGYCLTMELALTKPQTVTLRPEARIGIRTLNERGADLVGARILAVPTQYTPLLRMVDCGETGRGEFTLNVSRGAELEIVAAKNPPVGQSDGIGYCYYAPKNRVGSRITLGGDSRKLAQTKWDLTNAKGEHSRRACFDIEIPTLSMTQPIHFWCDDNIHFSTLTLWMTPASFRSSMTAYPDGCTVCFYPKLVESKAGQLLKLKAGGKLTPKLLFSPSQNPRQVCVSVSDQYGNWIRTFDYPARPDTHAKVRLSHPNGKTADEEMLYGTADKDLTMDPHGLDCEVTMDLGLFGILKTRGSIDDPKNQLQMSQKETAHFKAEWPVEFEKLFPEFERTAETSYEVISKALGVGLREKAFYRQTLFGPGWCGGSTFACHYFFLRDPRSFGYPDDTFKGAFAHELGHVFQGRSVGYGDFGGPSPTHKEAFATMVRNLAKEKLIGARAAKFEDVGNRQVFLPVLYDRAGLLAELGDRPYDRGEYWRYCFLVSHLMDIYGSEPLRYWAKFWGDAEFRKPWQRVMNDRGLTPDERVCATYSLFGGVNLSKLFTAAGLAADSEDIQAVLDVKAGG